MNPSSSCNLSTLMIQREERSTGPLDGEDECRGGSGLGSESEMKETEPRQARPIMHSTLIIFTIVSQRDMTVDRRFPAGMDEEESSSE